ncbi:MAG: EamA family transporter [Gemmatimonadota bacterium]|jgi:drug/metabolite transporter (DMT)-like permease
MGGNPRDRDNRSPCSRRLEAGLAGAISWLAYFCALRVGAAAKVASIDRLSVAFVVVFASLFLGERYGWRGWLGVVLVVAGLALVASDSSVVATSTASLDGSESVTTRNGLGVDTASTSVTTPSKSQVR